VSSLTESERQAIRLLSELMELDPSKRVSAKEALQHEFFTDPIDHDIEWNGPTESQDESGESAESEEVLDEGGDEMAML
jgi:cell division control protein 7